MAFLVIIAGCGGDSSSQLLETARLEERQNNQAHAMELYEQIIQAYPSSAAADEARTRLKELKAR
jgi:TolA-binding protein